MSASQRRKGKAGELEAAALLRAHGIPAERNLRQTRDSGADLDTSIGTIEVKRRKSAWRDLYRWLDETEALALMLRADGEPWLLVLRCNGTNLDMLRRYYGG